MQKVNEVKRGLKVKKREQHQMKLIDWWLGSQDLQNKKKMRRESRDGILGHWTKDSSLLLHAIHGLFYWRISQKTRLSSGFKNPHTKKPGNKKIRLYY